MKERDGFAIMAALALAGILAMASLAVLSLKKSIDEDTRNMGIKHAKDLAEDIVKSQVALKTKEVQHRNDLNSFVKSFLADHATGTGGFSVPIQGTECGVDHGVITPCNFSILKTLKPQSVTAPLTDSEREIGDLDAYLTDVSHSAVVFVLGLRDEDNEKLKFKINPIELSIKLPSESELQNKEDEIKSDLECDISNPIFKGTLPGQNGLGKDCRDVVVDDITARKTVTGNVKQVVCDIEHGYWLDSLGSALEPHCVKFPEGRYPDSVELCTGNQVARFFEFSLNFTPIHLQCVNKGSPYDFMEQRKTWGQQ